MELTVLPRFSISTSTSIAPSYSEWSRWFGLRRSVKIIHAVSHSFNLNIYSLTILFPYNSNDLSYTHMPKSDLGLIHPSSMFKWSRNIATYISSSIVCLFFYSLNSKQSLFLFYCSPTCISVVRESHPHFSASSWRLKYFMSSFYYPQLLAMIP